MWSDDQVLKALRAGAEADEAADSPEQAEPVTTVKDTPAGSETQPEPEAQSEPAAQDADLFDGTQINPDELPEELQPLVKQLQAAFTQKTQTLAEQRRALESLGSLEEVQQVVEWANQVRDPENWPALHAELTAELEARGFTPAQASQAAAETIEQQAATPQLPSVDEVDDPELRAVLENQRALQSELEQLKAEREQEQLNASSEYERQAMLGEIQRQHNAIQDAHPDWDEDRMLAVYEISSFHNGDLLAAASRLEAILASERELYLKQKAAATKETGTRVPPRGAGTPTQQVSAPETIRDAEAEAIEFFKARVDHYDNVA